MEMLSSQPSLKPSNMIKACARDLAILPVLDGSDHDA